MDEPNFNLLPAQDKRRISAAYGHHRTQMKPLGHKNFDFGPTATDVSEIVFHDVLASPFYFSPLSMRS
jgi:hypothetical protein